MTQPLILIQARLGGTRFPGKVFEEINGATMLGIVHSRALSTGLRVRIAMAEDWPEIPEEDVLRRLAQYIKIIENDPIIRLTADCPLLDSGQILSVLAQYQSRPIDLVSTSPAWDGLDIEVISRKALARADALAMEPRDREHVTPWIKRHGTWREIPLIGTTLRWSVDDPAGLEFVRRVFAACSLCADGVPRHTNASGSIGGADRQPVFDLHHLERGDLAECRAYDILKERMGGPVYVSS